MSTGIPFPDIGRELFAIDIFGLHLGLRYYALGYIVGIMVGWWIIRRTITMVQVWREDGPPIQRSDMDDLLTWIVVGVIGGGRLGYVLFYNLAEYLRDPLAILRVWDGGMSFHGGFLGVVIAVWLFARRRGLRTASLADLMAMAATPAIFLVRLANFTNAELWGRPTTLPFGVIFPGEAAQFCPGFAGPCARHPSQIYEALLEGALLGIILLVLAWKRGWLKKPGHVTGLFFLGYGLARIFVELFRQADAQFISFDNPMGYVLQLGGFGVSQGQLLSLPMVVIGIGTLLWARRQA